MFGGEPGTHGDPGVGEVAPLDLLVETQVSRNLPQVPPWSHILRAWWWEGETWCTWRNLVFREDPDIQGVTQVPMGTQVSGWWHP